MKRAYTAPSLADRCTATRKPLADGSGAQCMRKRLPGMDKCSVHVNSIMVDQVKAKARILADPRVATAWDEDYSGDGVWVSLAPGYHDAANPGCTCLHETSWAAALAALRGVVAQAK